MMDALPDLRMLRALPPRGPIAAVLHLHYPEFWPRLAESLAALPEPFDLFVTLTAGAGEAAAPAIRTRFPAAHVVTVPNRGRDILPFLHLAASGLLNRYELVCKLHGKRSPALADGEAWRDELVEAILGSPEQVARIRAAFAADPDLGLVVAEGNVFGESPEHWRANLPHILRLGARIGIRRVPEGARFPGGSIFWIRPFLLRMLAAIGADPADFPAEPLPLDGTPAHAVERLLGLICADAGMVLATPATLPVPASEPPPCSFRLAAYYLPQFHPVPENDAWWEPGFTEWHNVVRARPLFAGHEQPKLPGELGFTDLRLAETRAAQAALAAAYGIDAFCWYFYCFDGRRMLERPLNEMLAGGAPDFPFLLCWANEPWSRSWDGQPEQVLIAQDYAPDWPERLAAEIAPALADPRYLRL